MDIRAAYSAWATTYDTDRNLTRDLDAVVTHELLASLRSGTILEIGCGTGKNTAFLAQDGAHVLALDFSEGMLAQARTKLPAALAANVTFTVADLTRRWPCADGSVDLVVCNLVLEHIADLASVFGEAARCLRAGGTFFVCELHPFRQYGGSKAAFQRGDTRTEIPAFVHHLSAFLDAAAGAGLMLTRLREWWHPEDRQTPPRVVSFLFAK